jgi:hypothetical protein
VPNLGRTTISQTRHRSAFWEDAGNFDLGLTEGASGNTEVEARAGQPLGQQHVVSRAWFALSRDLRRRRRDDREGSPYHKAQLKASTTGVRLITSLTSTWSRLR